MTGLLFTAGVLLLIIGFTIGWVAKRDDAQAYAASRARHFERLARNTALELEAVHRSYRESERVHPATAPAVVHVHVSSPALPVWPGQGLPVLDGQVVAELPRVAG
jgi:hypothetical protein